jgi:hypothetical protein
VELTTAEQALLQTWALHRLHFIHHNGASALVYPLKASRLQHTLGVFALVSRFCANDLPLRIAALLHDVGHFPFCHSAELVAGVDHHRMTRQRIKSEPICGILSQHGLDAERILDLMEGCPPNPLRTYNGLLHLDHLDSWARQAEAAGYAEMPAYELLGRLRLLGPNVAADHTTAEYVVRLIRRGNERHYAEGDTGPATVLAHIIGLAEAQGIITLEQLSDSTDEALLARLEASGEKQIVQLVHLLPREPWRIQVQQLPPDGLADTQGQIEQGLAVELDALYDAVPLERSTERPITQVSATARAEMAQLRRLPGRYRVTWA